MLSQAFIEMDAGDKQFLQAISPLTRGGGDDAADSRYVLTIPHFWALVHLGPPQGQTMTELATLLLCDKGNVTAIVDKLEKLGWVTRERLNADDRRLISVVLTRQGRAVRQRVMAAQIEWVKRRFAGLTPDQLSTLFTLLQLALPGFRLDPDATAADIMRTSDVFSVADAEADDALLPAHGVTP
jgi:DNA-binding MarR family transcriptional regulator